MSKANALCLACCAALSSAAGADAPVVGHVRRDPFVMSAAFRSEVPPNAADASGVPRPAGAPAAPVAAWAPHLRGLMVAGKRSMVDLEGVMLTLGDSVDGYRLIKVGEREAVFVKKGVQVVLRLTPEKEPDK